jgi:hypothetical protein
MVIAYIPGTIVNQIWSLFNKTILLGTLRAKKDFTRFVRAIIETQWVLY